jgi:hypothetical protein
MVASWAFRPQFKDGLSTPFTGLISEIWRIGLSEGSAAGTLPVYVVPSMMTSVTKPWAETEGRRERTGTRARSKRGSMTDSDGMKRVSGVDTIAD